MSSPIGVFLRHKRLLRGLRQHEEAALLECAQAHVSAIELGAKIPSQEFLDRLAEALVFNKDEISEMLQASRESRRRFVLPSEVPTETYQLCSELWDKIDRLYPAQITAIRQLIRLDEQITTGALTTKKTIKNVRTAQDAEAEMK